MYVNERATLADRDCKCQRIFGHVDLERESSPVVFVRLDFCDRAGADLHGR